MARMPTLLRTSVARLILLLSCLLLLCTVSQALFSFNLRGGSSSGPSDSRNTHGSNADDDVEKPIPVAAAQHENHPSHQHVTMEDQKQIPSKIDDVDDDAEEGLHIVDDDGEGDTSASDDAYETKQSVRLALREKADQLREYIKLSWESTYKGYFAYDGDDEEEDDENVDADRTKQQQQRRFLDRDALSKVLKKLTNIMNADTDASFSVKRKQEKQYDATTENLVKHSDLSVPGRRIFVVTTASLPWMTGTSVNPLLRAAYLSQRSQRLQKGECELEEFIVDVGGPDSIDNDFIMENGNDCSTSFGEAEVQEVGAISSSTTTSSLASHFTTTDYEEGESPSMAPLFTKQMMNDTKATRSTIIPQQLVTLVVPWLELEEDRIALYGERHKFQNEAEQEEYIRTWLRKEAKLPDAADAETGLKIIFYPARYHSGLGSIFAMGDIGALIPDKESDVCILEEPEHLNWYRAPGDSWTNKFNYVVGIAHTNYKEYASSHYSGLWTAPAIGVMSSAMVRAYCHKVIKLSDVLQTFAPEKEATSNVHGVRSEFLREGERRRVKLHARAQDVNAQVDLMGGEDDEAPTTHVYFIGKLLWAKGFDRMLELESFYRQCTGSYFKIDIYGSGPEEKEIKRAFHGRKKKARRKMKDDVDDGFTSRNTASDDNSSVAQNATRTTVDMGQALSSSEELRDASDLGEETISSVLSASGTSRQKFQKLQAQLTQSVKISAEKFELDLPKSRYEWRRNPILATFPGRVDHATLTEQYSVFVNPSVSEVLCTTTAEALAMGKFVIVPVHPSNTFFMKFPNCLAYRNKLEFAANLRWAMVRLSSNYLTFFSFAIKFSGSCILIHSHRLFIKCMLTQLIFYLDSPTRTADT